MFIFTKFRSDVGCYWFRDYVLSSKGLDDIEGWFLGSRLWILIIGREKIESCLGLIVEYLN